MSLWGDFEADTAFALDFPFGIPCDHWTMRDGTSIPLEEMTTSLTAWLAAFAFNAGGIYNGF